MMFTEDVVRMIKTGGVDTSPKNLVRTTLKTAIRRDEILDKKLETHHRDNIDDEWLSLLTQYAHAQVNNYKMLSTL